MRPAEFKTARLKLDLTQAEMGKLIGVTKRQVINMEKGVSPIRQAYTVVIDKALAETNSPPDHGHQQTETQT